MKTIRMSTDIRAMIIDGKEIEDIFTDETMRFEVNPIEYYGLTIEQVDLFLFHVWYEQEKGGILARRLSDVYAIHGQNAMRQVEYKLFKEYEREWDYVRKHNNII